ncbi:MAG: asparagine synthase (glutamine-hydrolyzing), partial [Pirellulaceae bacterium]
GAEVCMIHRRLTILDLSEAGWQPMTSSDGRYTMVFNGEIYNFRELGSELTSLGCQFHSKSDSEVLLAGFATWGPAVLPKLIGMFAFAIWDHHAKRLFLARDFFGIKPLYFTTTSAGFAFASEIPVLLETTPVSRMANPSRLYLYLRYGITDHGDGTMFRDVAQLPAAHYMIVDQAAPSAVRIERYWDLPDEQIDVSFAEAVNQVRQLFLESVDLHLRSDAPVGAMLSGGIDSSAIVGAIRELRGPQERIPAFSFIPTNSSESEERWIRAVVKEKRLDLHVVHPNPDDLPLGVYELVQAHGEPLGGSSCWAQHQVFAKVRETGIKVMLDGQGGDELLGGYRHHLGARLASLVRQRRMAQAWRFAGHCAAAPGCGWFWTMAQTADYLCPPSIQHWGRWLLQRDLSPSWMNDEWFQGAGVVPLPLRFDSPAKALKWELRRAVREFGLAHLLRYEDRNSMAHSIESRVPFLTPQLARYTLSLPEEFLVSPDAVSKSVFREAMRGIIPAEIAARRDKIGFATPERNWLQTSRRWVAGVLTSQAAREIPVWHFDRLPAEADRLVDGRGLSNSHVWRWTLLVEWTRQFAVEYPTTGSEFESGAAGHDGRDPLPAQSLAAA